MHIVYLVKIMRPAIFLLFLSFTVNANTHDICTTPYYESTQYLYKSEMKECPVKNRGYVVWYRSEVVSGISDSFICATTSDDAEKQLKNSWESNGLKISVIKSKALPLLDKATRKLVGSCYQERA
tara:strand:+ start:1364 stop:1738 length:375 start_codon:yes stop_codon:yes gene_type:complete